MASSSSGSNHDEPTVSDKHGAKNESRDKSSLVEYFGSDSGSCGYCKRSPKQSGTGKRSHNLNTYQLTAADYQDMIDTNWRRSGNYCYNPINQTTCCPNYPIICKALDYQLTKSQRKCIKAVNSFLISGDSKSNMKLDYGANADRPTTPSETISRSFDEIKLSPKAKSRRFVKACERKVRSGNNITLDEAIRQVREKWQKTSQQPTLVLEDYLYPRKSSLPESSCNDSKPKHNLTIEMHHVDCKRSQDLREAEHSVMVRYQRQVHKETSKEWNMSRYCDFLVTTPLITEGLTNYDYLEPNSIDGSDHDKMSVDVEAGNASSYLLVKPPPLPTAFGTYHCCYHLDGRLIAVGVLDVLPKCVTTVYFFYEPDYAFLNLGIYSALIEISMVRRMSERIVDSSLDSQITDYYLGFYVHECKKMRYKTTFKPSFLLCSKTHQYVSTEICLDKLRDTKYADFAETTGDASGPEQAEFNLQRLFQIQIVPPAGLACDTNLKSYILSLQFNLGNKFANLFVNGWLLPYAKIVGDKLLPRLRLKLDGIHDHLLARHERLNQSAASGSGQLAREKSR